MFHATRATANKTLHKGNWRARWTGCATPGTRGRRLAPRGRGDDGVRDRAGAEAEADGAHAPAELGLQEGPQQRVQEGQRAGRKQAGAQQHRDGRHAQQARDRHGHLRPLALPLVACRYSTPQQVSLGPRERTPELPPVPCIRWYRVSSNPACRLRIWVLPVERQQHAQIARCLAPSGTATHDWEHWLHMCWHVY